MVPSAPWLCVAACVPNSASTVQIASSPSRASSTYCPFATFAILAFGAIVPFSFSSRPACRRATCFAAFEPGR
jgi:hypothetical protein